MEVSTTLQESLITLLCLDDQSAPIIRNTLPVTSFEGVYNDIAKAVYTFVDQHKKAPKANLDDVLEDLLERDNAKARRVERAMRMMQKTYDGGLHAEHILNRLDSRVRYHRVRTATREVVGKFNDGNITEETIDEMEAIFSRAVRTTVGTFDPGVKLGDKKRALAAMLKDDLEDVFPTGIKELDAAKLGPRRKQLHLLIGLKKIGKTRWLVQLGQHAAMQDHKVLHISLEMDEERMMKRYYQSFFAIADHRETIHRVRFKKDEYGKLLRVMYRKAKVRLALDDRGIRRELSRRIDQFGDQLDNIRIKSFPTRQLTFPGLVSYLDRLEMQEKFIPDLLIVDYPKIMNIDINNMRLALGAMLEDIRGLCVERNMAGATVAQSHRMRKGTEGDVDSADIGEDFSQVQTLDVGLVYRQSLSEAQLGLARIKVADARDIKAGWEVLISQNYAMGQFCVDSIRMKEHYLDMIGKKASMMEDSGEDDYYE